MRKQVGEWYLRNDVLSKCVFSEYAFKVSRNDNSVLKLLKGENFHAYSLNFEGDFIWSSEMSSDIDPFCKKYSKVTDPIMISKLDGKLSRLLDEEEKTRKEIIELHYKRLNEALDK